VLHYRQSPTELSPNIKKPKHKRQPRRTFLSLLITSTPNTSFAITKNMLDTIERNTFLADSKGLHLHAFREGYPPCGVPLNPDGTVDTFSIHGDQPGINEENGELGNKWGVMWADWTKMGKKKTSVENTRGPPFRRGMHQKFHRNMPLVNQEVLETSKPHDFNPFFAWWKHVPPQHPMMACFRPDTLYVIMVRHPKVWIKSLMKKRYDLMLDRSDKKFPWRLIRSNPRRLPPLDMRFQSLYHMWAYYMNGYLSWAKSSAGGDCYGFKTSRGDKQMTKNCLGENNEIPNDRRNILIVRQEDFAHNPKKILAQIFSFATRGVINAEKAENDFILLDGDGSDQAKKIEVSFECRTYREQMLSPRSSCSMILLLAIIHIFVTTCWTNRI